MILGGLASQFRITWAIRTCEKSLLDERPISNREGLEYLTRNSSLSERRESSFLA